jgi:hypothetical protein
MARVHVTPPSPYVAFLLKFLDARGLPGRSGPLYAYKVSGDEFKELGKLLAVDYPNDHRHEACFVLYAAEWWRQKYAGGPWKWKLIFEDIKRLKWNTPNKRHELVTEGFDYWNRDVFAQENGDNAYLGSIYVEAGLPIKLLSNENGNAVRALVVRAFEQMQLYRTEDPLMQVREVGEGLNLPNNLRTDAFYQLIEQVVSALLTLKQEYNLGQQPEPLAYLNGHKPNWTDTLPLWLDHNEQAGAFLSQLLVETARLTRREPVKIAVQYVLKEYNTIWRVQATLCIPDGNHPIEALGLTADEFDLLSGKVPVKIVTETGEKTVGWGFKNGNELSVRSMQAVALASEQISNPWELVLAHPHEEQHVVISLPYSDGLPTDAPWVFAPDTQENWLLKGTGSVRTTANRVRVVCPSGLCWQGDSGKPTLIGSLPTGQPLYEVCSPGQWHDPVSDQTFMLQLTEESEEPYEYMLLPSARTFAFPYFPRLHKHTYFGFPRLYRLHTPSHIRSSVPSDRVEQRVGGVWKVVSPNEPRYGRFRIRVNNANGTVAFSQEISVLPTDFGIRFDQRAGAVLLENSAGFQASVHIGEENLTAQISKEANGHHITLNPGNQPDKLRLQLSTPNALPITLYLPFPTNGGYFLDKHKQLHPQNARLLVHELWGNSLMVSNVSPIARTIEVSFSLEQYYQAPLLTQIRRKVKLKPFSAELIPLIRFRSDIRQLLSADGLGVDAVVQIQLGGAHLQVGQYTTDTRFDESTQTINPVIPITEGQTLTIQAFSLTEPFGAGKMIRLEFTEGGWVFPTDVPPGGKWFYFSTSDSTVQIRPRVAIFEKRAFEQRETIAALHEAAYLTFDDRQTVYRALFDQIAHAADHSEWAVLDALYTHTEHLSLHALDAWKALIRSDRGLVCFFLRSLPTTIERFTEELSIGWFRIPVSVWLEGVSAYREPFLKSGLPEIMANSVVERQLEQLPFSSVAQIIRVVCLWKVPEPDFALVANPFMAKMQLSNCILGQPGTPGLIARHQGGNYPTQLATPLNGLFMQLPESVRQLLPDIVAQHHYRHLRPLVLLPFVLAYHSIYPETFAVNHLPAHQVAALIEFDKEHFTFCFNLIQSYCWQTLPR